MHLSNRKLTERESINDLEFAEGDQDKTLSSGQYPSGQQHEEVAELTAQLKVANERLQKSHAQCQELMGEIEELGKNLQDAHDFIFTLQPWRQPITATEAEDAFKTVCVVVEDWVQTKLGDVLDGPKFPNPKDIVPEHALRFRSLVSPAGLKWLNTPDTDEYNVIAAIMSFLYRDIFDKYFWCPIELGAMDFLDSIEKGMRGLEPRRGKYLATIRSWRSETLIALANRNEFVIQRQKHIKALATKLTRMLTTLVPKADKQELYDSLKTLIIEPATTLAQKFQLSVDKFDVEWTGIYPRHVEDSDVTLYDCRDLLSGRTLKFPAAMKDHHVVYLFDVCPGLQYQAVKADAYQEPKMLNKPKILVASTKLEDGPFATPAVRRGAPATLLGWLEENRHGKKHLLSKQ